jgi:ADP-ribose pyrophosphatase YjhB (NUDIX family)
MSDKNSGFDAERLFKLKDNFGGYQHCPWCRQPLTAKDLDGHQRMVCEANNCGFVFYQNPIPAAGAIIVENDRVLLVKRAHPPRVDWWCIPAGFMEWNEHPTDTAVRELREETGLEVELTSLFGLYTGKDDPRVNAVLILYLAKIVGGTMQASDDALEVRFFSFDEMPEKIAFESHVRALADYRRRFRDNC